MNNNLIETCVQRQIAGLQSVADFVKTQEYERFYNNICPLNLTTKLPGALITKNQRIYISGVGKNSSIATKISESMASLGVKSGYINPTNYLHGDAGFVEDNDCVIYITRSGKTDEIHAMAEHLASNRPWIDQYLIHCNPDLPATEISLIFRQVLFIPGVVEGDEHQLAPTTSTTVFLCLLDTLTVALSAELGFSKSDFLNFHPGGNLGSKLRKENE